jgi:hypothetical protein
VYKIEVEDDYEPQIQMKAALACFIRFLRPGILQIVALRFWYHVML